MFKKLCLCLGVICAIVALCLPAIYVLKTIYDLFMQGLPFWHTLFINLIHFAVAESIVLFVGGSLGYYGEGRDNARRRKEFAGFIRDIK